MASLSNFIINSRQDLEDLKGTIYYTDFMKNLKGSIYRKQDIQVYPENYNSVEYSRERLVPIWEMVEDLSTIKHFGFEKSDFDNI